MRVGHPKKVRDASNCYFLKFSTIARFKSSNRFLNLENQFCRFRFAVLAKWSENWTEPNFGSPKRP